MGGRVEEHFEQLALLFHVEIVAAEARVVVDHTLLVEPQLEVGERGMSVRREGGLGLGSELV
jgi:hypothetical protein